MELQPKNTLEPTIIFEIIPWDGAESPERKLNGPYFIEKWAEHKGEIAALKERLRSLGV